MIAGSDATDDGSVATAARRDRRRVRAAALIAAVVLVAAFLGYFFNTRTENAAPAVARSTFQNPSILILPFAGGEGGSNQNIGSGLADALSSKLGNVKALQVLSPNTGRLLNAADPVAAARELGVTFVVSGELTRSAGSSVLKAEMVNTGTNEKVWSQEFTADEGDLFALQKGLAEKVLSALDVDPLPLEQQQLDKSYTRSTEAYQYYLLARSQTANRSRENLRKAIDTFSRSVEIDPGFAPAYVGLADSYALLNLYDIEPPKGAYDKARENAKKALEIDDDLAEAHASLAYVKFYHDRDRQGAELEFRRAIQLNPSYAQAHHWFALALAAMNRPVEAISEAEIAQRLDPRSASIKAATAIVYFMSGRNAEALAECEKALSLDARFVPALKVERWVYTSTLDRERAYDVFQKEMSYSGGSLDDAGWKIIELQLPADDSERPERTARLDMIVASPDIANNPYAFAFEAALAYNVLGQTDKALDLLERAEAAGSHSMNLASADPRLANLRGNPRYERLIAKMNR
jgi:TolB-like protein/Tfp pilus assembly protein PilF